MFGNLFGMGAGKKVKEALDNNGVVIDVRTPGEFSNGHAEGAVNIPLDQIPSRVNEIKEMEVPVVVCCASGMRSAQAQVFLKGQGVNEIHNAGPWTNIA